MICFYHYKHLSFCLNLQYFTFIIFKNGQEHGQQLAQVFVPGSFTTLRLYHNPSLHSLANSSKWKEKWSHGGTKLEKIEDTYNGLAIYKIDLQVKNNNLQQSSDFYGIFDTEFNNTFN